MSDPLSSLLDAVDRLSESCAATTVATADNWQQVFGDHGSLKTSLVPSGGRSFHDLMTEALAWLVQRGAKREEAEGLCHQAGLYLEWLFWWRPVPPYWRDADPDRPGDPQNPRRHRESCENADSRLRQLSKMRREALTVSRSLRFLAAGLGMAVGRPVAAPVSGPSPAPRPLEAARAKKPRMSVDEANDKAMDLAKRKKVGFLLLPERRQAKEIGCSWETWAATEFYKTAKRKKVLLARQALKQALGDERPHSPRTVTLTENLEAAKGKRDEALDLLTGEQLADKEPSPLEDDPPGARPRKVRNRKRL